MPLYEYECPSEHRFDLRQSFDSEPRAVCPTCESVSRRLILAVPVHYKGSGFYTTDYGRSDAGSDESTGDSSKESDGAKKSKELDGAKKSKDSTEAKSGASTSSTATKDGGDDS